jgi:hypothetical protein
MELALLFQKKALCIVVGSVNRIPDFFNHIFGSGIVLAFDLMRNKGWMELKLVERR